jgi:DNA-binding IscR family transcriptional regulator
MIALADRYNGRNNSAIPYSVKETMAWLHCSHKTARRTFSELKNAGLIEVVRPGSFNGKKGTATLWRLTFLHNKHRSARSSPAAA